MGPKKAVKRNGKVVRYTQKVDKKTTINYNKKGKKTSKTTRY